MCLFPGLALTYILENSFKPESGARTGIPKIGILITDGKSQDDVQPPAQSLRNAGIELFAIGKTFIRAFFPQRNDIFFYQSVTSLFKIKASAVLYFMMYMYSTSSTT